MIKTLSKHLVTKYTWHLYSKSYHNIFSDANLLKDLALYFQRNICYLIGCFNKKLPIKVLDTMYTKTFISCNWIFSVNTWHNKLKPNKNANLESGSWILYKNSQKRSLDASHPFPEPFNLQENNILPSQIQIFYKKHFLVRTDS